MNSTTTITEKEAYEILDEVSLESTPWQAWEFGNARMWTVPSDFVLTEKNFPHDSQLSFTEWAINDNGTKVIRAWSKW